MGNPACRRMIKTPKCNALFLEDSGGGEGLPVLFLNSIAADHQMWNKVRELLPRRSVAFDARGHGASDVVADDATLDDLVDDALAVMDAANLERAVVCGLSLGGLSAMRLSARAPERVAGLVLANTAVNFPPASMWEDRARTARGGGWPSMIDSTVQRWLSAGFQADNADIVAFVRDMLLGMPPNGYASACAVLASGHTVSELAAWRGSLLIIAGSEDQSTPVERHEEMLGIAPQAELVVLRSAHLSAIEKPKEFAEAVERFVRKLDVSG